MCNRPRLHLQSMTTLRCRSHLVSRLLAVSSWLRRRTGTDPDAAAHDAPRAHQEASPLMIPTRVFAYGESTSLSGADLGHIVMWLRLTSDPRARGAMLPRPQLLQRSRLSHPATKSSFISRALRPDGTWIELCAYVIFDVLPRGFWVHGLVLEPHRLFDMSQLLDSNCTGSGVEKDL
jgi:hypothetical protein